MRHVSCLSAMSSCSYEAEQWCMCCTGFTGLACCCKMVAVSGVSLHTFNVICANPTTDKPMQISAGHACGLHFITDVLHSYPHVSTSQGYRQRPALQAVIWTARLCCSFEGTRQRLPTAHRADQGLHTSARVSAALLRHILGRYGTDGLLLAGRGCTCTMCCTPYCCPRMEVNCASWLVSQHRRLHNRSRSMGVLVSWAGDRSHPFARLREAHGGAGCVRGGSMRSALQHTCEALHCLSYRCGPGPHQCRLTEPDQRGSTLHMQSCWTSAPRRRHDSRCVSGRHARAGLSPSAARARSPRCA